MQLYIYTGHDAISYFRSAFLKVQQQQKTAENAASYGFGSNLSGAAFCLAWFRVNVIFQRVPEARLADLNTREPIV